MTHICLHPVASITIKMEEKRSSDAVMLATPRAFCEACKSKLPLTEPNAQRAADIALHKTDYLKKPLGIKKGKK